MKNNDDSSTEAEPDEIVLNIFAFLDVLELLKVSLVCKRWRRIANDNILWRSLVLRRWPSQAPVLRRVSTPSLQWQKLYRYLSAKGCYSPDDMKYFIVCREDEINLDSDELRQAVLNRMEDVTSSWEKPGHYELEETSPRFFNNNMELYYDTHDLKWVFVDRRREYVDDSFTIRLNLDRMASRQMRFIRPYQVMASCVMMYRWLLLFKHMFTEDIGLTFYRIWRFRLKHIKTGFIFETYDWKAAMSSTFSHGCPIAESFKDEGLAILDMLSSPFFVTHPMGNNAYKMYYEISLDTDSIQPLMNVSRSSSVETLDSGRSEPGGPKRISESSSSDTLSSSKSGSEEVESEENCDDSGYFCNCEHFIHRSSWEYEEQQMIQAESASKWEIIDCEPEPMFELIFDSCEEKWLFSNYTHKNLQHRTVLSRKLIDKSLEIGMNVNEGLPAVVEVDGGLTDVPSGEKDSELTNTVLGQEAMPSSLTLYRMICLFDLSSIQYRSVENWSIWSISLQHKLTRGIIQLKDLNGWLHVFVSLNEELKLYCNDLAIMSLNDNQSFAFLHDNKPQGATPASSKLKDVEQLADSSSQSEGSEASEDDFGNPLEKFRNDVCSFLQLLVDQKFAHPYGTVAGAVA